MCVSGQCTQKAGREQNWNTIKLMKHEEKWGKTVINQRYMMKDT